MILLDVKNISKHENGIAVLNNLSFQQKALQKIAIAGESGAGKTTLLKILSGHLQTDEGIVLFNGEKVKGPNEQLLPGHSKIAYLSQHYELRNNYRIEELIWFDNTLPPKKAKELFEICRINHFLKRRTDKISGGEKQRIALCMLLVKQPELLVLDEPFSNLDPIHTGILKEIIEDVRQQLKISCMLASHDPDDTLPWADEILVLKEGKLLQKGIPDGIYHKPINEYVAGLFGKYNLLKPAAAKKLGIAPKSDVMLRPEEFSLSKKSDCGVKGLIKKLSFWGSFFEAEVLVDDVKIIVKLVKNTWSEGDEVFVTVN